MTRPLVLLLVAVACEVTWAVALKLSRGFTVLPASCVTVVAYVLSLISLNLACKNLDISTAYAIWTGSGSALVALVGVCVFDERLSAGRAAGFALVVAGVIMLFGLEQRAAS
jgi:small multidrug resistance pump